MSGTLRLRELDERFRELEVADPPPALHREHMEAALADLRTALREAEEECADGCEVAAHLHALQRLVSRSPLVRLLRAAPAGHEACEYLCEGRSVVPGGAVRQLEEALLALGYSRQHRNRLHWQGHLFQERGASDDRPPRVLSLACKGSRDLAAVVGRGHGAAEIVLSDPEPAALETSVSRLRAVPCRTLRGEVLFSLLRAQGPFDLVLAGAFFDLLPDPAATLALRQGHALLGPGGRLALSNLAATCPDRPLLEPLLGWWPQERTEVDVLSLCEQAGIRSHLVEITRDVTGLAVLAVLRRE